MDNLHFILSRLEPMLAEGADSANGTTEQIAAAAADMPPPTELMAQTSLSGFLDAMPPPTIGRQLSSGYIDDSSDSASTSPWSPSLSVVK